VDSCHGVISGKSSAEHSANYPLLLFRIPQMKNSAFPRIAKLPFAHTVQQMCNRCIPASGVPWSLPSVLFVLHLQKYGSFLQFQLTSQSLPHSKCHVILLVDVIGFNLYNRCKSHTNNRTKLIMFNTCDTGRNSCRMTAAAAVATDRRDNRIV